MRIRQTWGVLAWWLPLCCGRKGAVLNAIRCLFVVSVAVSLSSCAYLDNAIIGQLDNISYRGDPSIPEGREIVMPPLSTIRATTPTGTIGIRAGSGLRRFYTWDGATRSVAMLPRDKRWHGGFGIYYPGSGYHWLPGHKGIRRGVLEEGWQTFPSQEDALEWIRIRNTWVAPYVVYRDDGLLVGYGKSADTISVEVWQILINGKKQGKRI